MANYQNYGKRTNLENDQVINNAGGISYRVNDVEAFKRFLILGTNGGTYYIKERQLTKDHLKNLENLLDGGLGKFVIDLIIETSLSGKAVSNDPALFALARCCACDVFKKIKVERKKEKVHTFHREHHPELFQQMPEEGKIYTFKHPETTNYVRIGEEVTRTEKTIGGFYERIHPYDLEIREYAFSAVNKVARTGTHWLHFQSYIEQFRGRGSALKRASKEWYESYSVEAAAFQTAKYQQRDGWSQRDVLRLSHPKVEEERNLLYKWIVKGEYSDITSDSSLKIIYGMEAAKKSSTKEIPDLIRTYNLSREMIPTEHLSSLQVWETLLEKMPLEATLRNLATMTKNGVLTKRGSFTKFVSERLQNREEIKKARLHPIKILAALTTYENGKGVKGHASWEPLTEISKALENSFTLSFDYVQPTGKKTLLAIDVSGSMHGTKINGIPNMDCHMAAAAMALVTAKVEKDCSIVLFDTDIYPLDIPEHVSLDLVLKNISRYGGGGTNCSLPMQYALKRRSFVDSFVLYTDSESWHTQSRWGNNTVPMDALKEYREAMNSKAKIINVQMAPTALTNADPKDRLALDVIGFDTSAPSAIENFIAL